MFIHRFNDSLPPRSLPVVGKKQKKPTGLKRPVGVEIVGATVFCSFQAI